MRSLKLIVFATLSFHAIYATNPFTKVKESGDWMFRNVVGYIDISPLYHPHTTRYFENLKIKYPLEFQDVSLYILSKKGPGATLQSVYFPIYWVEKLEQEGQLNKRNGLFTEATEWVALHEAGHIKNNDGANMIVMSSLITFFKTKSNYYDPCKTPQQKNAALYEYIFKGNSKNISVLCAICALSKAYWAVREYRADDFATQHCTNPNSIAASYEILQRQALSGIVPGLQHSFKNFRLKRIADAYKQKFGHEIPKTYHETDRVTA